MRLSLLLLLLSITPAQAQSTQYSVKLVPDFEHQLLHGEETIDFRHEAGDVAWRKQTGLQVSSATLSDGEVTAGPDALIAHLHASSSHRLHLEYSAAPARGIKWFAKQAGFDTVFYCEAWMVCDSDPAQRATLTLEIVLPASSGFTAVGPGQLKEQWRDNQGDHFVFVQDKPVQTYLFSFGVAALHRVAKGRFVLYAFDIAPHESAFTKTADAYAFLQSKAGVDLDFSHYTQAAMPADTEQEAAAMALMTPTFLSDVEQNDDLQLMTHELAHQWWGVLVGIRSWSDFWLNEGFADFMTDAYLEKRKGRAAYDLEIAAARKRLEELRAQGLDRPLHWDGWQDAHGALGRIPYVKGALFLDRLRSELGDDAFWRGIAFYTSRHAHGLVDSRDFEHAMEVATGRDLKPLFDSAVYQ